MNRRVLAVLPARDMRNVSWIYLTDSKQLSIVAGGFFHSRFLSFQGIFRPENRLLGKFPVWEIMFL